MQQCPHFRDALLSYASTVQMYVCGPTMYSTACERCVAAHLVPMYCCYVVSLSQR